jgi:hypothetical protein
MLRIGLDEIRRSPGLCQSVVQILVGSSTLPLSSVLDWNPTEALVLQVRAAQEAGQLDAALDPLAFTLTLSRTMLMETQPLVLPLGAGLDPVELLLRGAGMPPSTGSEPIESSVVRIDDDLLEPDPFPGRPRRWCWSSVPWWSWWAPWWWSWGPSSWSSARWSSSWVRSSWSWGPSWWCWSTTSTRW